MSAMEKDEIVRVVEEHLKSRGCYTPTSEHDRKKLMRRVSSGVLKEIDTGLFVPTEAWGGLAPEERVLIAVKGMADRHPSWLFCNATAALIWGLDVPRPALRSIHVQKKGHRGKEERGIIRFHAYRSLECVRKDEIRVTSFERTLADCLMTQPFDLALAIADSALREKGMQPSELAALVRREGLSRPGVRRALAVASFADARAENGGESRVRAFLIQHGYPMPELQVEIPNPLDSSHVFRVDFYWVLPDGRVVVGEFDGMGKYREAMDAGVDLEQIVYERQRESRISMLGCSVVRFTFDDLRHPEQLHAIFAAAGLVPDTRLVPNLGKRSLR